MDDRDDGVEPGFLDAPELMVHVEEALRLVNRDVATIGPGRECRFRFFDEERGRNGNAYVETWDGHTGSGCGVHPREGADPVSALVAVAEDAQDAVMHALWSAWPVCPGHRGGVHAREHDGAAVWWCGGGGHAVALIGEWPHR
ncbi:hypothetical protein [Actinoplanes subglobosus]|uniref:Uncharacterized protein n=1 Tax=Actinoplanes subglobosus TaxID=1547892 RepID=A0ABV8IVP9_9ACTN